MNRWQNDNINKENDIKYICTKLPLIYIYLSGLLPSGEDINMCRVLALLSCVCFTANIVDRSHTVVEYNTKIVSIFHSY